MILKGQYFMGAGKHHTKPMLATDENEHGELSPLSNGWGGNPFVMPITVRRMFELLGCPVPEGWRVIEGSCGISLVNAEGTLFTYEGYGWQAIGTLWFSSQRLDLSDLPVTEEVIRSLPEPLQRKWKELL